MPAAAIRSYRSNPVTDSKVSNYIHVFLRMPYCCYCGLLRKNVC